MLILLTCFPVRHRSVPLLHYYSKLVAGYDKVWFKWCLFLEKNNDATIKKLFCYKNEFLYMLYFMCIACANRKNIFAFAFCFLICKPTIPSISPPITNIYDSQVSRGTGYLFNSSVPDPTASQTLRYYPEYYCRELNSAHSWQRESIRDPLVSELKSLTVKLCTLIFFSRIKISL